MHRHTISFRNAAIGIWTALITQTNIRIHTTIGSLALLLGVYLDISFDRLIALLLLIAMVLTAELINTALEFACDAITTDHNQNIKHAKDISAGAVLLVSIFAVIIGIIIFIPAFSQKFFL